MLLTTALVGFLFVGTNTQQSPSFIGFMGTLIVGLGTILASVNSNAAKESAKEAKESAEANRRDMTNGVLDDKIRRALKKAMKERAAELTDGERSTDREGL